MWLAWDHMWFRSHIFSLNILFQCFAWFCQLQPRTNCVLCGYWIYSSSAHTFPLQIYNSTLPHAVHHPGSLSGWVDNRLVIIKHLFLNDLMCNCRLIVMLNWKCLCFLLSPKQNGWQGSLVVRVASVWLWSFHSMSIILALWIIHALEVLRSLCISRTTCCQDWIQHLHMTDVCSSRNWSRYSEHSTFLLWIVCQQNYRLQSYHLLQPWLLTITEDRCRVLCCKFQNCPALHYLKSVSMLSC